MQSKKNKFERFNKKTTLNKELLTNVKGGGAGRQELPAWVGTVSGDCNASGNSCWGWIKGIFG